MKFGYVRVSSRTQNESRQIEALSEYVSDRDRIIIDRASGKNFERSEYQTLKRYLREGDELYVQSLDRFGRNKEQIKSELEDLKAKKVRVHILDIPTTLMEVPEGSSWLVEMLNNILIEVMSAMAEQERKQIRERQAEGIAQWKKTGKTKTGRPYGRPPVKKPKNWDRVYEQWKNKQLTSVEAMLLLGLKKNSFYKFVNEETAQKNVRK